MNWSPKFSRLSGQDGQPILGQYDFSVTPRYATPASFAGLPRIDQVDGYRTGVLGIPFDSGVTFRPGARFGPEQIRSASRLLRPFNFDQSKFPFNSHQVADLGNLSITPFSLEEAIRQMWQGISEASSDGQRIVLLGGDHSIAYPSLKVIAEHNGPVAVLHFDAHLDTWDSYFGSDIHHGAPFRLASEQGFIDQEASMHVGIRGPLYGHHDFENDERLGFRVIPASDFMTKHITEIAEQMKSRVAGRKVYVSIDIDVLDPAYAPGTGTPEPGGLTSAQLLFLLRQLADVEVVGADIVETSPAYDHADITSLAAAHAAYEILSLWT